MNNNHSFFKTIAPSLEGLDSMRIVISKNGDTIVVSVLPISTNVKDKAVQQIQPLNISGTADELDESFFSVIQKPVEVAKGLFTTLKEFEASVEDAEKNSDMQKKQKDEDKKSAEKEKKKMEENDKKVKDIIAEVNETYKDNYDSALKKLEDTQRKELKLSNKVQESLENMIDKVKKAKPQASLFK